MGAVSDVIIEVQRAMGWGEMVSPYSYDAATCGNGLNHIIDAINWANAEFIGKHPYRETEHKTALIQGQNKIAYPSDYGSTICLKADSNAHNIWVRADLATLQVLTNATVKAGDLGLASTAQLYYICTAATAGSSVWSLSTTQPRQYDINPFEGNIEEFKDDVNNTGPPSLYIPTGDYIRFDVYADADYPISHWYNIMDAVQTKTDSNYSARSYFIQTRFGRLGDNLLKQGALYYIKKDMEE
jgi:hypothetical protein